VGGWDLISVSPPAVDITNFAFGLVHFDYLIHTQESLLTAVYISLQLPALQTSMTVTFSDRLWSARRFGHNQLGEDDLFSEHTITQLLLSQFSNPRFRH
jgi:hypothetical protein